LDFSGSRFGGAFDGRQRRRIGAHAPGTKPDVIAFDQGYSPKDTRDDPRSSRRSNPYGEWLMASVYEKAGKWYLHYKDARGKWRDKASSARTKTEAKRLAGEVERRCERQRLGLEPLPPEDGGGTFDEFDEVVARDVFGGLAVPPAQQALRTCDLRRRRSIVGAPRSRGAATSLAAIRLVEGNFEAQGNAPRSVSSRARQLSRPAEASHGASARAPWLGALSTS
jgi:hypothetical protein